MNDCYFFYDNRNFHESTKQALPFSASSKHKAFTKPVQQSRGVIWAPFCELPIELQ